MGPRSVIFPFDDAASRCPDCRGVFHRGCFAPLQGEAGGEGGGGGQCPRCERRRKAEEQRGSSALASVEDEEVVEATVYDEALKRDSGRRGS